jgi:DtxR family Mn-dependent transcriptional regulator
MNLTYAEENYLKTIRQLSISGDITLSTNSIASKLHTSAASVTDMLKKLSAKNLIHYKPYQGASLTEEGNKLATQLIRKHRLWKVFLSQSLGLKWDEIHDIAGELEHINSDLLIDKLDEFLGHPKFDPHGDPIPNAQGRYSLRAQFPLAALMPGQTGIILGVRDSESAFLKHLTEKGIAIGKKIEVISTDPFDQSMQVIIEDFETMVSAKVTQNVLIKKG